jgi:hypothetical protein
MDRLSGLFRVLLTVARHWFSGILSQNVMTSGAFYIF